MTGTGIGSLQYQRYMYFVVPLGNKGYTYKVDTRDLTLASSSVI
jgi:hypothetical protein